jgi:hypothetical protein
MDVVKSGFFWGAPSHKPIAWVGALSGLAVVALAIFLMILGHGAPLFLGALLGVGLANLGWAAELLPRHMTRLAGWVRVARLGCALMGSVLSVLSLVLGLSFGPLIGAIIAGGAVLQVVEFAPSGPANRP